MIGTLFKIQLSSLYNTLFTRYTGFQKKKPTGAGRLKFVLFAIVLIYALGAIGFSYGFIFMQMARSFSQIGLDWLLFANVGIMSFGVSVVLSIFISQSMLFEAKDNEMLLSMPIKPSHILGSRLLVLAAFEYAIEVFIMIVAAFSYVYVVNPPATFYPMFIFSLVFFPLMGLTASCIFGFIVSFVSSRMKNRSLFVFVISIALLGIYLWLYFSMMGNLNNLIEKGMDFALALKSRLPMFYYFGSILTQPSLTEILLFLAWCIIPTVIVFYIISLNFINIATTKVSAKKTVYREQKLSQSSVFKTLLSKEMSKLLNSPMYMLNSGLAFLLNVGLGVYVLIKGNSFIEQISASIPNADGFVVPLITAMLCALAVMGYTTAPSISLEGKNLWILKSSPIRTIEILNAKIGLNLVLGIPTLLFAAVCMLMTFPTTTVNNILILALPIAFQFFSALGGLIGNLFFPKFDFVSEASVVKNSASVLASLLASMGVLMTSVLGYVAFNEYISFVPYAFILLALMIIIDVCCYAFIYFKGTQMFENM